jgi:hypothetical protein
MHRQPVEKGTKGAVDVGLAWQSPVGVRPAGLGSSNADRAVLIQCLRQIKRIKDQKNKTNRSSKFTRKKGKKRIEVPKEKELIDFFCHFLHHQCLVLSLVHVHARNYKFFCF